MASHREELETGKLRAFLIDECHLMWGDLNGYVWGTSDQEISVPVVNEREKQTYYGAVDYLEGDLLLLLPMMAEIQKIPLTTYNICLLSLPINGC